MLYNIHNIGTHTHTHTCDEFNIREIRRSTFIIILFFILLFRISYTDGDLVEKRTVASQTNCVVDDGIRHDMKITRERTKKPVFTAGHDDDDAARLLATATKLEAERSKELDDGQRFAHRCRVYNVRIIIIIIV